MRTLVIVGPKGMNENLLGKILLRAEERKLIIAGVCTKMVDIHNLNKKIIKEKEEGRKKAFEEQLKVPSVLIALEGKEAISFGKEIKKEYYNEVHVSENSEVAKYEIERFFGKENLFEYEKLKEWIE